jgi:hypothetical protein
MQDRPKTRGSIQNRFIKRRASPGRNQHLNLGKTGTDTSRPQLIGHNRRPNTGSFMKPSQLRRTKLPPHHIVAHNQQGLRPMLSGAQVAFV